MTKQELKVSTIGQLFVEYVQTSTLFVLRLNGNGRTSALYKHMRDIENELLKRGVLTAEQIETLNR